MRAGRVPGHRRLIATAAGSHENWGKKTGNGPFLNINIPANHIPANHPVPIFLPQIFLPAFVPSSSDAAGRD